MALFTIFPRYLTDEFLVLLENMFAGKTGPHIDNAVEELCRHLRSKDGVSPEFQARVLEIILRSQIATTPAFRPLHDLLVEGDLESVCKFLKTRDREDSKGRAEIQTAR